MEQLVVLNVHALRRIARGLNNFPIKGRDISKANRAKLLDYFKGSTIIIFSYILELNS